MSDSVSRTLNFILYGLPYSYEDWLGHISYEVDVINDK